MNYDEKLKCSEIYEIFSGIQTKPENWNETAVDHLAEIVSKAAHCTKGTRFTPKPVGSMPGWGWLVGYCYDVIKSESFRNKHKFYDICMKTSALGKRTEIELAFD
ncbi:hypothetical protein [Desulfoluna sp.]|uniref:hypothetical protein n=1 Tax=Desulfoluna sp. TaxID=2045199 RepID=UPI00260721BD|nr:hypothetical protein [Desulfoluna sp.]